MTLNELMQKLEEVKRKVGNGNIEVKGINIDTGCDGEIRNVGHNDYAEDEHDWQNNEDVTYAIHFAYIEVEF